MMINKTILTDTVDSSFKSVDQLLDQREVNEDKQVEIDDSLIQEYNLHLFEDESSNIGVANYATHLFYDNANLNSSLSQSETVDLFTGDVTYHQSNIINGTASFLLVLIWLAMTLIVSAMIIKIIRRRRDAKKNRNRVQTAQLYY